MCMLDAPRPLNSIQTANEEVDTAETLYESLSDCSVASLLGVCTIVGTIATQNRLTYIRHAWLV